MIAAFLLGPERLPRYAAKLGQFVRSLRDFANGAKDRMRDEMGPEFDEVDWKKLDPRQYDPRRIIREALLEDAPASRRRDQAGDAVRVRAAAAHTAGGRCAAVRHRVDLTPRACRRAAAAHPRYIILRNDRNGAVARPGATVARYAIGSLGTGGFATLPGLVLVYYLTDTLGVAAIAAGARRHGRQGVGRHHRPGDRRAQRPDARAHAARGGR